MAISKATWVGATVCVGPKLLPPSVEVASTIALFWTSCQATCTAPSGPTNGSAPISALGPDAVLLANTGAEKVVPPSVERLTSTPLELDELPVERSQAT